ncbi:class I lanthipeptide [Chitinophaga sp.]|uniref:class I lanthipeptide n=1 Tax=Chitinophaga sp. TaxID=1869181 RepID=UPI0031DD5B15
MEISPEGPLLLKNQQHEPYNQIFLFILNPNQFMKKINIGKKLSLDKETIAKLNEQQMQHVQGGDSAVACTVSYFSCAGQCPGSQQGGGGFASCCEDSCHKY